MIKEIGIVGQGFVGGSINSFFKNKVETHTFDLNGKCTCSSLDELVKKSELIFICLPTPMYEDGSCDLSIISNTIKSIKDTDPEKIVVIKSTVVPGTVQKLIDSYDENIIFNPEFLTEANAANDFEMQDRIILGGYGEALRKCEGFFAHYFQNF
jgi:Predicted UDP-glucose 6-dehydrogenase